MRMNRCNQILKKAISLKDSLEKFVGDANRLTDKLLELCNKPVQTHTHNILHNVTPIISCYPSDRGVLSDELKRTYF